MARKMASGIATFTKGLTTRLVTLGAAHYGVAVNAVAQHIPHPHRPVPNIPGSGGTGGAWETIGALQSS